MNPAPALTLAATVLIAIGTLCACAIELIKRRPIMGWLIGLVIVAAIIALVVWWASNLTST